MCVEAPHQGVSSQHTLRGDVRQHEVLHARHWARPGARVGLDVALFLEEVFQGWAEDEDSDVEEPTMPLVSRLYPWSRLWVSHLV